MGRWAPARRLRGRLRRDRPHHLCTPRHHLRSRSSTMDRRRGRWERPLLFCQAVAGSVAARAPVIMARASGANKPGSWRCGAALR
jgi:hypothetical protein